MKPREAAAATSVAVKPIMDGKIVFDLRFYQKGIYFRTSVTPLGERKIDRERLISDKYLMPHKGYETGLILLYRMGLTRQMSREHLIVPNMAKECIRTKKSWVWRFGLPRGRSMEVLGLLDKAPIEVERPYAIITKHIREHCLQCEKLLFFADRYYNKDTVLQLAQTAEEGGYVL